MKKQHLAATGLACVVATLLMVGATTAPEEAYTNPPALSQISDAMNTVSTSVYDEIENVNALMSQAAEEQAAEQAEAERAAARAAAASANTYFNSSNASSTSSNQSYSSSSNASESSASKSYRTITVDGVEMSYTESYGASSAPGSGAGVWKGSDSTTDGSYGYFIGHNPGSFKSAATIDNGSQVTVNDSNGDSRTYTVVDSFVVSRDSTWGDISDEVTSHGESVVLQTCVDGGYRIVIAE